MQNPEKFYMSIFHKTWKTSFWIHFGSKTPEQDFSKKSSSLTHFSPVSHFITPENVKKPLVVWRCEGV